MIVDGKAIARRLLRIFFSKNEMTYSTIAVNPKLGKVQLNQEITKAIVGKFYLFLPKSRAEVICSNSS